MRVRLGERTKRKPGRVSNGSNSLHIRGKWWYGDLRIFLFNQDGSRQRLAVLVIFATIIYLYQTGALAPFVRWLSQGMHRAAVPPPPRPNRPDNDPAAAVPPNEDAAPEGQENGADNWNRANKGINGGG